MRFSLTIPLALGLLACGPSGTIEGKVSVQGGSAKGLAVFAYGPTSGATVTGDDGSFSFTNVADGEYVVRAVAPGTDEGEQSLGTTVSEGAAAPAPSFEFHASSASVSGRVAFTDGSDAAGLTVLASGPQTAGTVTTAGGAFTFPSLKNGAYAISVEVRDTREGRVGIGVDASGSVNVGELTLTPGGRLTGTISFGGAPAVGISVTVPGTGVAAVSADDGTFELVGVPTGVRMVLARVGSAPFYRSTSQEVTVVRGTNPALALELSDEPPKTGTVTGVVTFSRAQSPTAITVTVEGTDVSSAVSTSGSFSLDVPVGVWRVVATAPSHPLLVLGEVEVHEGQRIALPGRELSWYQAVWRSDSPLTSVFSIDSSINEPREASLVHLGGSLPRLAVIRPATGALRVLTASTYNHAKLSRTGRFAAWSISTMALLQDTLSGQVWTFPGDTSVSTLSFASDESVLFIARGPPWTLTRVSLANPETQTVFPTTVSAQSLILMGDRWLLQTTTSTPHSYDLVAPTVAVPNILTNVAQVNGSHFAPTIWARTNCTASACTLKLIPPALTADAAVTSPHPFPGTGVVTSNQPIYSSPANWPCFETSGTTVRFCIEAATGAHYPLPAGAGNVTFNATGTRMAYLADVSMPYALYEHALPPPASPTPLHTNNIGWNIAWISPTRVAAIENGAAAGRSLFLVTDGVAAPVDTDTGNTFEYMANGTPLLVVPQASTGKWRAMLGDGPWRTLDLNIATSDVQSRAARRVVANEPVTRYATVSFYHDDSTTTFVLDEVTNQVRRLPLTRCVGPERSGPMEFASCHFAGFSDLPMYLDLQRQTQMDLYDPLLLSLDSVGAWPTLYGLVGVSSADQHVLLLGTMRP